MIKKLSMRIYLFLFTIGFIPLLVYAQERNFIRFSVADGLPLSQITAIEQYKDSYLLLGTYGAGFCFFDGNEFFILNRLNGLSNNTIFDLAVDDSNNIWIGTINGINKFDGSKFEYFKKADGLSDNLVRSILNDKDRIIIGTEKGLDIYQNGSISRVEFFENKDVRTIYKAADDYYIGTRNGLYICNKNLEVKKTFTKYLTDNPIDAIYENEKGLFVGTRNGLIIIKDGKSNIYTTEHGLTENSILSIYDNDKYILFGSEAGITKYDYNSFSSFTNQKGLSTYLVNEIYRDNQNILWFSTEEGLYKLIDESFVKYNYNDEKLDVWGIHQLNNGDILVGAEIYGILRFRNGKFIKENTGNIFKNNTVTVFFTDSKNELWMGSDYGIIKRNSSGYYSYSAKMNLPQNIILDIYEDNFNNYWIANYADGVHLITEDSVKSFRHSQGLTDDLTYTIVKDKENNIWIGADLGLNKFVNGELANEEEFAWTNNHSIMQIIEDNENNLWLGTYETGLIKYNYKDHSIDTVNTANGLNDNAIVSMIFDNNYDLWIGTNKGINKFFLNNYLKTGEKEVIGFSTGDGFPGVECIQSSTLLDSEGYLWFGTVEGLIRFDPGKVEIRNRPPDLNITSIFTLNHDFVKRQIYTGNYKESFSKEFFNIDYEENNITIEYTSVDLKDPFNILYKYKINNSNWSPATKQKSILLNNLDPGEYSIQIAATDNPNYWDVNPVIINFVVNAPFWLTYWFWVPAIFAIGLVLFFVYKFRVRQVFTKNKVLEERIKERVEYQKKLETYQEELVNAKDEAEHSNKLKSEFLAQMSHEIRTPVNTILSFSSLLKNDLNGHLNDDLKDSFTIIENGGRRLIKTIDSILNMSQLQAGSFEINKTTINLCDIIKELVLAFQSRAKDKNLELRSNCGCKKCEIHVDEYTVTQLIENLLENAIKYTHEGYVEINVEINEDSKTVLKVKDTGIGISQEFQKNIFTPFSQEDTGYTRKFEGAGLGLALVKQYAELNNIDITLESEKGKGSTFTITFGS